MVAVLCAEASVCRAKTTNITIAHISPGRWLMRDSLDGLTHTRQTFIRDVVAMSGHPTQSGLNAQHRVSPENYCSAIIVKMQRCPSCAHILDSPPNDVLESFLCPYCGKQLKVALRYRTTILAVGAIAAIFMQAAKLVVSPKINMEKTSRLPFVLEGGLTHLFWRTKLVRVSPSPETSR
jgi:predicted RNA-binding Zn-ribbon protein involved in translation (DUF1610 family)